MAQQSEGTQINLKVQKNPLHTASGMAWIEVAKEAPYFVTDTGENWTSIGQNDAITWPDLQGAFRRKNLASVEAYLHMLA